MKPIQNFLFVLAALVSIVAIYIALALVLGLLVAGFFIIKQKFNTVLFIIIMVFGGLFLMGMIWGIFKYLSGRLLDMVMKIPTTSFRFSLNTIGIMIFLAAIFSIYDTWTSGTGFNGWIIFLCIVLSLYKIGFSLTMMQSCANSAKEQLEKQMIDFENEYKS